ncbi:hypothetical protein C7S16_1721 [Burkholderia thailandensis]|uniref:Uncharacterized protein n=1 Tax=Burkholderia thailandensis TaxID=57975 RepID=A0AAW9D5R8_BURTH|nr:hypothetical protein [Burkholderia thailandensis]
MGAFDRSIDVERRGSGRGRRVTAADARAGFPDSLRSNGLHKN